MATMETLAGICGIGLPGKGTIADRHRQELAVGKRPGAGGRLAAAAGAAVWESRILRVVRPGDR
jgi:hypothetical protein